MISLKNIYSLSDFLRNAKSHLTRLKKSGEPEILTVNGQAQAVVLSAEAYQKLLSDIETAENLNAIHQGLLEAERGNGIPAEELIQRLRSRTKVRKSA